MNCCRIVAVEDGPGRFGYTIATLPHHSEIGRERFRVEEIGGEVWYDVQSHSGPNNLLVRLAWPAAERAVRRFLRESGEHMAALNNR